MVKILLICQNIPSFFVGATLPYYHLCKHLNGDNELYLFYLHRGGEKSDISEYTHGNTYFSISEKTSSKNQLFQMIKNQILYLKNSNLRSSFFNIYYYPPVQKIIDDLIHSKAIECVISDAPMAFFVKEKQIPKIVYALDAISENYFLNYKKAHKYSLKIQSIIQYLNFFIYERSVYNKFNSCIVVSQRDKKILEKYLHKPIYVIPNGVDTDYFSPQITQINKNSIVFVGDMSSTPNIDAIINFYHNSYIQLKKIIPSIKLTIVGRNPSPEICALTKDSSITVTGEVEDVRPFIASSTLVITPMISGMGIKNKILEAMSMGKVVVTTSIGCIGINIINNKNGIIADSAEELTSKIVDVLRNHKAQILIGENARKTVLEQYQWDISMGKIVPIIEQILRN